MIQAAVAALAALAAVLVLPACEPIAETATDGGDPAITLVLVGDVGLNFNRAPVHADGIHRDRIYGWQELTAGIAPLIDGDVNFMNLETVVTDTNVLRAARKGYTFRSHPDGVRHLVDIGFNLVSLANNHSYDYRRQGMRHTLRHVDSLRSSGLLGYAGLGENAAEAAKPSVVHRRGESIAFAAISIAWKVYRAGENRSGQLHPREQADIDLVTRNLREAGAGFSVLSIHEGLERRVRPAEGLRRRWRGMVTEGGVDLIAGHHAHVARGVERIGDSLIFWGLGNFLFHGDDILQRVWSYQLCRDFGLLARVHLLPNGAGALRVRAVEIVPIGDVSRLPKPLPPQQARERVEVVNYLSAMLDDPAAGAMGLRFAPQGDGSGLYCFDGAAEEPGKIGQLCRAYGPPASPAGEQLARIEEACRVLTPAERRPGPSYGHPKQG